MNTTHQTGDRVQVLVPGLHARKLATIVGPHTQGGTPGWHLDVDGHDGGPLFFMPEEFRLAT